MTVYKGTQFYGVCLTSTSLSHALYSMAARMTPYTVMLIGRTGLGKSTMGNKLLNAVTEDNPDGNKRIMRLWPVEETGCLNFETKPDDFVDSITKKCELLSSRENVITVLDTEGFAGSDAADVRLHNLKVARAIAGISEVLDLKYDRVLYFLPCRGIPERADAHLQKEIEVMWHFFGRAIFQNMVLACTLQADLQIPKYTPNYAKIQRVVTVALERVLRRHSATDPIPPCPPVLYIPFETTTTPLISSLKEAEVHGDNAYRPQFRKEVCTKCAGELRWRESDQLLVEVSDGDNITPACDTMCHPIFIPKYSKIKKIVGGIAHIAVLGFAKVHERRTGRRTWPGFLNTEEVCAACQKPPGSEGCMKIMVESYKGQRVKHSVEVLCEFAIQEDN